MKAFHDAMIRQWQVVHILEYGDKHSGTPLGQKSKNWPLIFMGRSYEWCAAKVSHFADKGRGHER